MNREEIISGLKFTEEMFLFDPSTGKTFTEPRNNMDKTTIDACRCAIELLEQEPNREIEDYENEIEDLHNRLDIAEYDKERLREEVTNLEEKIKALEQEPCKDCDYSEIMEWEQDAKTGKAKPIYWCERHKELCDDVVSRQTVKEQMIKCGFHAPDMTVTEFVEDLPPITPTRPKGKWEWVQYDSNPNIGNWHCSECGRIIRCTESQLVNYPYCHCGADMKEGE